jgi:hypothetical protein
MADTLRRLVRSAVHEYLGRAPIDLAEEVQIRKRIYDANPYLQRAVLREERGYGSRLVAAAEPDETVADAGAEQLLKVEIAFAPAVLSGRLSAAAATSLAKGLIEAFSPTATAAPRTLREMVAKAVRDHLGRDPLGKDEEVRIRRQIYEGHPGLQRAVLAEERAERRAGA